MEKDYFVDKDIRYISQFTSRELVSDILDGRMSALDDPKYQDFGFPSKEEYEFWSWRLCGLVCVKMILEAYNLSKDETVYEVMKKAIDYGGYIVYDNGKFVDRGGVYKPLVKMVKSYGLNGFVFTDYSVKQLCDAILKNNFIVASVNPKVIRFDVESAENKGGHLVVVNGFKIQSGECMGFYIYNPSGRIKETQERAFIPLGRFLESYSGRGFYVGFNLNEK